MNKQTGPEREAFVFYHRLQVRWAEVDAQAVVFNANYLMYFDTALRHYWRALALPMGALQADISVRETDLDFLAPARLDDWLDVRLRCTGVDHSSITMRGAIFRGDRLLVTATVVLVLVDVDKQTSKPVPEVLRIALEDFEAARSVLETRVGPWSQLGAAAHAVREAVFVQEQGIPREDEWDQADERALHAVAFNRLGQGVATGRLLQDDRSDVAHIGRVAVLRSLRGTGLGVVIMQALEAAAGNCGIGRLQLNAQQSAQAFYLGLGYVAEGEPFQEVGIPHVSMQKVLRR